MLHTSDHLWNQPCQPEFDSWKPCKNPSAMTHICNPSTPTKKEGSRDRRITQKFIEQVSRSMKPGEDPAHRRELNTGSCSLTSMCMCACMYTHGNCKLTYSHSPLPPSLLSPPTHTLLFNAQMRTRRAAVHGPPKLNYEHRSS